MKVVLTSNPPADIPVKELPPGVPAVITKWGPDTELYPGTIVQIVANNLITFGSAAPANYWPNIAEEANINETHRVRPLKVGETLAIVE